MPRPELSLVIPVFNEEEDLPQVDTRMKELLTRLGVEAEVVFVDDGSRDRTMDRLLGLAGRDARYRVVSLSRRFGREIAIAAGLDRSRGRAVIVTDTELQPPEVFLETIDKWKAGFDVVFGKRKSRAGESFGAGIVSSLFGALMPIEVPLDDGDFRLLSRRVVAALRSLREAHPSPRALISWAGFRQTTVEFERLAAEKAAPGFGELLSRALHGIGAFSTRPLRIATWIGALLAVCSIVFGIVAAAVGLGITASVVPFLFSVQFVLIGILGEYVGRIYEQVKRRPLYVVSQRIGFASKKREQKLVTRDLEELPSFPRTPSVPPALPQRASRPPSLSKTPAAPAVTPAAPPAASTAAPGAASTATPPAAVPTTARAGSTTSEVPPPPAAVVAAGAAAEHAISQPRQRAASLPPERTSVTPAPPLTGSAKPPPLKLSSSMGAIPAAPPVPVIPERASTPPVAPRRPSFASIPHPAAVPPPPQRASRPPSLPRTPSAPPVAASARTPSVPPVAAAPRTPSAPPVAAAPRTPSAPPVSTRSAPPASTRSAPPAPRAPSIPRMPAAPRPEVVPATTRSPSTAPAEKKD